MDETTNNTSSEDLVAQMTDFCQERVEQHASRNRRVRVANRILATVTAALLTGASVLGSMSNKNWTSKV